MQITQKIVATATAASMAISLFVPMLAVHAATNPFAEGGKAQQYLKKTGEEAGIRTSASAPEIVGRIINIALSLLGLVFLGLALYAGFKWMTAQGDSKEVDAAKDTLKNSVIGLIVIMASYALSNFVISQLFTATQ